MSRFVDKSSGAWVSLGPCSCPGSPHEEDRAFVRDKLSGSEWAIVRQGNADRSLAVMVATWNLVDDEGKPVPVNVETIGAIDLPTFEAIDNWIGQNVSVPDLPKGSGERSPDSSPDKRSRTPKAPKVNSSTTPPWSPAAGSVSTTSGTPPPSS